MIADPSMELIVPLKESGTKIHFSMETSVSQSHKTKDEKPKYIA